jgi:putative phosphoesterase
MKIAVISDSHDHLENLEAAIEQINQLAPPMLIHCGDLSAPFVVERLAAFGGPVHIVFGNNEGDRFTIQKKVERHPNLTLHGEVGFVQTDDGEIAFTHRPEFARGLASTGRYRAVFYGHTHRRKTEKIDETYLVNPGELMGLIEEPGWLLFDPADGSEEHFTVGRIC